MWKIRNFPGGKEFLLRAKFGLPSVAAEEEQVGRYVHPSQSKNLNLEGCSLSF